LVVVPREGGQQVDRLCETEAFAYLVDQIGTDRAAHFGDATGEDGSNATGLRSQVGAASLLKIDPAPNELAVLVIVIVTGYDHVGLPRISSPIRLLIRLFDS